MRITGVHSHPDPDPWRSKPYLSLGSDSRGLSRWQCALLGRWPYQDLRRLGSPTPGRQFSTHERRKNAKSPALSKRASWESVPPPDASIGRAHQRPRPRSSRAPFWALRRVAGTILCPSGFLALLGRVRVLSLVPSGKHLPLSFRLKLSLLPAFRPQLVDNCKFTFLLSRSVRIK